MKEITTNNAMVRAIYHFNELHKIIPMEAMCQIHNENDHDCKDCPFYLSCEELDKIWHNLPNPLKHIEAIKDIEFRVTYKNRITKTKRIVYIESSTIGKAAGEADKKKRFFEEFISIEKVR